MQEFARQYDLDCPYGIHRLELGVTAQEEHGGGGGGGGGYRPTFVDSAPVPNRNAVVAFELSGDLVTLVNLFALENDVLTQAETLLPLIQKIFANLKQITNLPPGFEGVERVKGWIAKLNVMAPTDRLQGQDKEQLKRDMNWLHTEVKSLLH